jgi:hypothetical protein
MIYVTSGIGCGLSIFVSFNNTSSSFPLTIKIIDDQLYEKLARAIHDSDIYYQAYRVITNSLARDRPDELRCWLREIEAWEADPTKPCPYDVPRKSKHLQSMLWPMLMSVIRKDSGRCEACDGTPR